MLVGALGETVGHSGSHGHRTGNRPKLRA
jgi:hypothetical protein